MNTPKTLKEREYFHRFGEEIQDGGGKRLASWSETVNLVVSASSTEHSAHGKRAGCGHDE